MSALLDRAGLVYEVVEPAQARAGGSGGGDAARAGAATAPGGGRSASAAGAAARGTTIVLRGVETDPVRLAALARTAAPAQRLVVPQPLRFLYLSRAHVGHRWFVTSVDGAIEPATFADALFAVEQLTVAAHEQWGAAPLLVGHGQGGELALALAALVPERLSGVVAFDAALPDVPGWERPECSAAGLRVALLQGGGPAGSGTDEALVRADEAALARTRRELRALGAEVDDAISPICP